MLLQSISWIQSNQRVYSCDLYEISGCKVVVEMEGRWGRIHQSRLLSVHQPSLKALDHVRNTCRMTPGSNSQSVGDMGLFAVRPK
jgi:hypothetical protein